MLHDGLYEQVINKGLDAELAELDKLTQTAPIDTAEASKAPSTPSIVCRRCATVPTTSRLKNKRNVGWPMR